MKMINSESDNKPEVVVMETDNKQLTIASSPDTSGANPNPPDPDFDSSDAPKTSTGKSILLKFVAVMTDWPKWPKRLTIVLFSSLCIVAVSLVLLVQFDNNPTYKQNAGESAINGVIAGKNLSYNSPVLTKQAQDKAASEPTNLVYVRDEATVSKKRDELNALLDVISSVQSGGGLLAAPTLVANPQVSVARLTTEQIAAILALTPSNWQNVRNEARNLFSIWMQLNIRPDQLSEQIIRLNNSVYTPWIVNSPSYSQLNETERSLAVLLAKPFIVANTELDKTATERKQAEARQNTREVVQVINKGQTLINKGDKLTELQVEMLERLGLRKNSYEFSRVLGTLGLASLLVLVLVFYFGQLLPHLWSNRKVLAFIALAFVLAALGMRLLGSDDGDQNLRAYALPVATAAIVLAALFDVNLALLVNTILALLAGLVVGSLEMSLVFFVGGAVAALLLWKAERSLAFAYAGIAVTLGQAITGFMYNLLIQPLDFGAAGLMLLFSALNGLIAASLAFFIFSVLGRFFGIATVIHLLELAHPTQPLLGRLMREAPGTYHHSMLVGTLAEQAAERLEGDALLARVGAYYHDIGKLTKPTNFIDNQGGGTNIHDTLDPRQSVKIIRAHVCDGVDLARKNHLPTKVVDIIEQHHGTCLIYFFYQKALSMGLDVGELDFRYPGPKPQTKVAALVMLADGCEAAVRANVQSGRIPTGSVPPTGKTLTIADVVNKIVDDRSKDGQLDESDLTLRDIDTIRHIFVDVLTGIYHPRIDYPDNSKKTDMTVQVVNVPAVEIPNEPITPVPVGVPSLATTVTEALPPASPASGTPAADAGGDMPPNPPPQTIEPEKTLSNQDSTPKKAGGIGGAGRKINPDLATNEDK